MDLYLRWILGLAQDLKQVVIREEVEAREYLALGLEIHIERLLYLFEAQIHLVQLFQKTYRTKQAQSY